MNKIHLVPIVLTGTSCFAEIRNGEFEINLTNNDIKENFEKTFNTLKNGWDFIIGSPKEGELKNNNSVYFSIKKDKIELCDFDDNNSDKYNFYSYYIDKYVTLKEKVCGSYNLMNNKHEINDIKTCEIEINIPEDYISRYKNLSDNINILKKKLFNDKNYGFLIFNNVYNEYIKEHHRSFNIELKGGKFIVTANKEYVEKNDSVVEHEYYIKVFIDQTKKGDYVVNDKFKDFNLEKIHVHTYSLGNKKNADDLIEDFKKCGYVFNIEGYKLCDGKGKEITGKNLKPDTYYIKNDRFFTKKTILESYNKFLKDFNENLVNGVEELICRESISEVDFKNNMTAINEFFEKFSDDKTEEYIKYKKLFEDINYGKIIYKKFEYLNELRRKLMAMYMYKNVIANVTTIINKLKVNDFSSLNINDFFDDYSKLKDYSNKFILGIYEKFEKDFIKDFSVNGKYYYNDVEKQNYGDYKFNCVTYEISNLIGHKEYDNYRDLQKKLENLLGKNKDNLFANVYKIDTDITELKESDKKTLEKLVEEINDIKKIVLYRKKGIKLAYSTFLNALNLPSIYKNYNRVLFFDIFVDGEKVVFDYNKKLQYLYDNEVLPEGKRTMLIKFYDCVEAYEETVYKTKLRDDKEYFDKISIAQICKKDYEEKEIEKIKNITSLAELKKNYEGILKNKDEYIFADEIKCLYASGIGINYKHSNEGNENYIHFYNLPNIYKAVVTKLQQLEIAEMDENAKKGVKEIEDKYKGLVDIIIQEINSTDTLEKLNKLPYSKKENIRKYLEDKVKSEVADYDNKKSKIPSFDVFVSNYVEQVYNAYNTKSSGIIKDEQEKKIKAAEEEEKKRKKEEEDKENKEEENKENKDEGNNTSQSSTEGNGNKPEKTTKKRCYNCNKKNQ